MSTTTPAEQALRILAGTTDLSLATADADGRPWATPVWYAHRDTAAVSEIASASCMR